MRAAVTSVAKAHSAAAAGPSSAAASVRTMNPAEIDARPSDGTTVAPATIAETTKTTVSPSSAIHVSL